MKKNKDKTAFDIIDNVVRIKLSTDQYSVDKMDVSCLNKKGKQVLKNTIDRIKDDMIEHFKKDKWDISLTFITDEVTHSVLPSIDWVIISEIMSSVKDLSVQSKENKLVLKQSKGKKKNVK